MSSAGWQYNDPNNPRIGKKQRQMKLDHGLTYSNNIKETMSNFSLETIEIASKISTGEFSHIESPLVFQIVEAVMRELSKERELQGLERVKPIFKTEANDVTGHKRKEILLNIGSGLTDLTDPEEYFNKRYSDEQQQELRIKALELAMNFLGINKAAYSLGDPQVISTEVHIATAKRFYNYITKGE